MKLSFYFIFVLCFIHLISSHRHYSIPPLRNGSPIVPCATEDMWQFKEQKLGLANCTTRGSCDDPVYRDEMGSSSSIIVIRTSVHLMNSQLGAAPDGVGQMQVDDMVDRLDKAYGAYGINFDATTYTHNDGDYYCIPAYSGTNQEWYNAIEGMKNKYAIGSTLNIFISCQTPSFQGTLFGIGTFPWDSAATTDTGGLWLNSISVTSEAQAEGDITAEHEMGHCLGLWHTFHGSDEVLGCNLPCEELPHSPFNFTTNYVGDFCSDTPATPRNYDCANPGGNACDGDAWGTTDYTNYMGYGMDPQPCGDHFTEQQRYRMHCWTCDALTDFVESGC